MNLNHGHKNLCLSLQRNIVLHAARTEVLKKVVVDSAEPGSVRWCEAGGSEPFSALSSGPSSLPDAIHATVQPAGETPTAKMVPGHLRQREEENGPGTHAGRAGSKAQDVQLPGVEGPQSRL